jgi:hypothetical protein
MPARANRASQVCPPPRWGKAIGGGPYFGLNVAHRVRNMGRPAEYPLGERANPSREGSRHDDDGQQRQAKHDRHRRGCDPKESLVEDDLSVPADGLGHHEGGQKRWCEQEENRAERGRQLPPA